MRSASEPAPHVAVEGLTIAYGERVLMSGIDFTVAPGDVFAIMGGSGSGKTTLLRAMVGLKPPASGSVRYGGESLWQAAPGARERLTRRFGVLYQQGALWSSMTLAENVALPLGELGGLGAAEVRELVALKLALVGLAGFEDYYPAELSGGMRKRAALARAIALDPEVLYFDEPSAGLDPLSSRHLDELILALRDSLGATVIMVTHELPSILAIATNSVFLDGETGTQLAVGDPRSPAGRAAGPQDPRLPDPRRVAGGGGPMTRQPSPKLIGAFVLGALALLAAGLVALGGVGWLGDSRTYVAYFAGSVKGLQDRRAGRLQGRHDRRGHRHPAALRRAERQPADPGRDGAAARAHRLRRRGPRGRHPNRAR